MIFGNKWIDKIHEYRTASTEANEQEMDELKKRLGLHKNVLEFQAEMQKKIDKYSTKEERASKVAKEFRESWEGTKDTKGFKNLILEQMEEVRTKIEKLKDETIQDYLETQREVIQSHATVANALGVLAQTASTTMEGFSETLALSVTQMAEETKARWTTSLLEMSTQASLLGSTLLNNLPIGDVVFGNPYSDALLHLEALQDDLTSTQKKLEELMAAAKRYGSGTKKTFQDMKAEYASLEEELGRTNPFKALELKYAEYSEKIKKLARRIN